MYKSAYIYTGKYLHKYSNKIEGDRDSKQTKDKSQLSKVVGT